MLKSLANVPDNVKVTRTRKKDNEKKKKEKKRKKECKKFRNSNAWKRSRCYSLASIDQFGADENPIPYLVNRRDDKEATSI